jgi:Protein of unknown function (DUF3684)
MVRTGDWGIPDLIRYLVVVEDSLTPVEIERLRETVAFTKEEGNSQQTGTPPSGEPQVKRRWRAMDLYEPSSVLRDLDLPIIAWGASPKWRSSSDEGFHQIFHLQRKFSEAFFSARFLFRLGLQRYPPLKDLLLLAAGPNAAVQQASLKYFIDNASSKYPEYDVQKFHDLAYVPAQKSDGVSFLGQPLEVCVDITVDDVVLLVLRFSLIANSRSWDFRSSALVFRLTG